MRNIFIKALFALALLVPSSVYAAEQKVKLSVPGMSCASCPYMVKKAISAVDGVKEVSATMEDKSATVVFDDAVTSIETIQKATANIGYESTPMKN